MALLKYGPPCLGTILYIHVTSVAAISGTALDALAMVRASSGYRIGQMILEETLFGSWSGLMKSCRRQLQVLIIKKPRTRANPLGFWKAYSITIPHRLIVQIHLPSIARLGRRTSTNDKRLRTATRAAC